MFNLLKPTMPLVIFEIDNDTDEGHAAFVARFGHLINPAEGSWEGVVSRCYIAELMNFGELEHAFTEQDAIVVVAPNGAAFITETGPTKVLDSGRMIEVNAAAAAGLRGYTKLDGRFYVIDTASV